MSSKKKKSQEDRKTSLLNGINGSWIVLQDINFSRLKELQTILSDHYGLLVSVDQLVNLLLSQALSFDDKIEYHSLIVMIVDEVLAAQIAN
jgi:hypothetical protein